MKHLIRALFLLMLLAGSAAHPAHAQLRGMIEVDGVWHNPTPAKALEMLLAKAEVMTRRSNGEDIPYPRNDDEAPTIAVLRQVYDLRSAAELDALADELKHLFLHGNYWQAEKAFWALTWAGWQSGDGIRYARAVDIFIEMYESYSVRTEYRPTLALRGVMYTGGEDYIRNLFESSEKPPFCSMNLERVRLDDGTVVKREPENACPNVAIWCDAARLLVEHSEDPPDPDDYFPRCRRSVKNEDGSWVEIVVH